MSRPIEAFPLENPDTVASYFRGYVYRTQKDEQRKRMSHLKRFDDIVTATDDYKLEPMEHVTSVAFVPRNYFGGIVPEDEEPYFLKYLLESRHYSIKSKIAQSGIEVRPVFRPNESYLDSELVKTKKGYYFPLDLINLTPANTYLLPNEPFPLMRFFWPCQPIRGRELLQEAPRLSLDNLVFCNPSGQIFTEDELRQLPRSCPQLNEVETDAIDALALNVVTEASYAKEPKEIKVLDYLSMPHTQRNGLDHFVRLDWETGPTTTFYNRPEVVIGATSRFQMPADLAGVIVTWISSVEFPARVTHIASPLIDPEFGMGTEGGLAIRLERENYMDISADNKLVQVCLYRAQ